MRGTELPGRTWIVGLLLLAGACAEHPAKVERLPWNSDETASGRPAPDEVKCLASLPMVDPLGLILLPVAIRGEDYLFLLDTGATCHVLDSSLRNLLGRPLQEGEGVTSAGSIQLQAFRSPELRVAGLGLNSDHMVVCMDLEILRMATGHDVRGVLGIPLFKEHRVRLDWERGEIGILDPAAVPSETWGDAVRVGLDPLEGPTITADLGSSKNVTMLVVTGMDGTLTLGRSLFGSLEQREELRRAGSQILGTAGGVAERFKGELGDFRPASWSHENLIASEGETNKVGLRYLRRFCVTFDLANRRMYLRPSQQYGQLDRDDMSGLRLVRRAGQVVVHDVAPGSPAERSGVRGGDVITRIDGKNAAELSMSRIRDILRSQPGRQVKVECQEGMPNAQTEVILTLQEEPWRVQHGPEG